MIITHRNTQRNGVGLRHSRRTEFQWPVLFQLGIWHWHEAGAVPQL